MSAAEFFGRGDGEEERRAASAEAETETEEQEQEEQEPTAEDRLRDSERARERAEATAAERERLLSELTSRRGEREEPRQPPPPDPMPDPTTDPEKFAAWVQRQRESISAQSSQVIEERLSRAQAVQRAEQIVQDFIHENEDYAHLGRDEIRSHFAVIQQRNPNADIGSLGEKVKQRLDDLRDKLSPRKPSGDTSRVETIPGGSRGGRRPAAKPTEEKPTPTMVDNIFAWQDQHGL